MLTHLIPSLTKDGKLQVDVAAKSESFEDNDGFVLRCPLFISSHDITPSHEQLKSNFQFMLLLFTNWQMRRLNHWKEWMWDRWGYNNEPWGGEEMLRL